jgi:hypothetical protein
MLELNFMSSLSARWKENHFIIKEIATPEGLTDEEVQLTVLFLFE